MSLPYRRTFTKKISKRQEKRLAALYVIRKSWWALAELDGKQLECHICHLPIVKFSDLASDHVEPGKIGGCRNDDEDNLKPAHHWCNTDKGSLRKPKTKAVPRRVGRAMKKNELDEYLKSSLCFCLKEKRIERPCCDECFRSLPGQLQLDLQRTGAETPTLEEYTQILVEVELHLFNVERQKGII